MWELPGRLTQALPDYILGEDEESETKALGGEANIVSSKKSARKESAKEGNGNETAKEEEGNGKKAAKTRRKKGSRKNTEEDSDE